jgi:N-acetylneuraminic acid mutarotase
MLSVALLLSGAAAAPASGWRQTAVPPVSAFDSRAALVGGKVLIVGGYGSVCVRRFLSICFDRHGYLPQAELYDPHRGTFSLTRPMKRAREGHTATALAGGEVLVAGGFDGQDLASAELYVPGARRFVAVGGMRRARWGHTATPLASGGVLIAGGIRGAGPLAEAEVYDPAGKRFVSAAPMFEAREGHTATLLRDGRVLVAGGYGGSGPTASVEIYDPLANRWLMVAPLHQARDGHTATLLPDGRVLVAGGVGSTGFLASSEIYDPASNAWSSAGQMGRAREGHAATLLASGRVLVSGGSSPPTGGDPLPLVLSAEIYDPATNSWRPTSRPPTSDWEHTSTLLGDGRVLIVGEGDAALYNERAQAASLRTRIRQRTAGATRKRRRRPGCGAYCQLAGGIGDPVPGRPVLRITTKRAKIGADGIVRIRVRCVSRRSCSGVLGLAGGIELGRDDLAVAARRSALVDIQVSPAGRRLIRRRRRLRAEATALLRQGPGASAAISLLA